MKTRRSRNIPPPPLKGSSFPKSPPPPLMKREINTVPRNPSIGSTIMDGMALGVGSSLGHRAMESIFGPRHIQIESSPPSSPPQIENSLDSNNIFCKSLKEKYEECIKENTNSCFELNDLLLRYNCN